MEKFLTIIIPIYNEEKYLRRCMDSIVVQIDDSIELICVNDGSLDRSLSICEEYAQQYPIKIISQKNAGVSIARNVGLQVATGRWITFVDADDFVDANFIEVLRESAQEELDLVIYDFDKTEATLFSECNFYDDSKKVELTRKAILMEQLVEGKNTSLRSPCAKIYNKKTLVDNHIMFDAGIGVGEDMLFNIRVYNCKGGIKYITTPIYTVIPRMGSATKRFFPNMVEMNIELLRLLKNLLYKYNLFELLEKDYYKLAQSGLVRCLRFQLCCIDNEKSYKIRRKEFIELLTKEVYVEALKRNNVGWKKSFLWMLIRKKYFFFIDILFKVEWLIKLRRV